MLTRPVAWLKMKSRDGHATCTKSSVQGIQLMAFRGGRLSKNNKRSKYFLSIKNLDPSLKWFIDVVRVRPPIKVRNVTIP